MTVSRLIGALFAATILTAPAFAQTYPERQITMVVPFSAGGPTDTVARLVAERMSDDLGQQIVIQNVGGAGGTLGAAQVANAEADGYTVLLHHIGMATSETLYRNLPYETLDAFDYVGLVTEVPMVITARQDFEPADFPAFVDYVKANADSLTLANAGIGAASHLCGLLWQNAIATQVTTVPYRGTAPAMTDLVGGTVDVMCDQTTNTTEQIKAGSVRAFAVTTKDRLAALPDLPTVHEAGLPGMEVSTSPGSYTPRGTPAAINERLSSALRTALKDPHVVARFAELGTAPVADAMAMPKAHRDYWMADIAKWRPVIQEAGQYAD